MENGDAWRVNVGGLIICGVYVFFVVKKVNMAGIFSRLSVLLLCFSGAFFSFGNAQIKAYNIDYNWYGKADNYIQQSSNS